MIRLGVNIDHVATLRQTRRGDFPQPSLAAVEARRGGADLITLHLREDRRHIQDHDLPAVRKASRLPINLEMALDPGIVRIALKFKPYQVCLVPEKRKELTTEGGLDVITKQKELCRVIPLFRKKKIKVSLFIDASERDIIAAARMGADSVEIHTGTYAHAPAGAPRKKELARIARAAQLAHDLGLAVHAGHGLDYRNVGPISRVPHIEELNIGYAIVSEAVYSGMRAAVWRMKQKMRSRRR